MWGFYERKKHYLKNDSLEKHIIYLGNEKTEKVSLHCERLVVKSLNGIKGKCDHPYWSCESWFNNVIKCNSFKEKYNAIISIYTNKSTFLTLIIDNDGLLKKSSRLDLFLKLLGEIHRLKQPTLARLTIITICVSYFTTRGLVENTELTSHHQREEFRKGQRDTT